MSLNGLEDAKVQEAFEGAAAEPGGWYEKLSLTITCCVILSFFYITYAQ